MAKTHQRGVFFVSEGQLVGSEDQRGEGETDPLVSTCPKVFPCCVQDLKGKVGSSIVTKCTTKTFEDIF